jgi:hypothetical protein
VLLGPQIGKGGGLYQTKHRKKKELLLHPLYLSQPIKSRKSQARKDK